MYVNGKGVNCNIYIYTYTRGFWFFSCKAECSEGFSGGVVNIMLCVHGR